MQTRRMFKLQKVTAKLDDRHVKTFLNKLQ